MKVGASVCENNVYCGLEVASGVLADMPQYTQMCHSFPHPYCVPKRVLVALVLRVCVSRGRATWLILPVVIRLSQRLSHACLSINNSIL